MKKSSYIGMFRTVASVIVALVSALVVSSCNGMIYDDQGDCSAKYRLMFRYDYNMKFADAFAHEVKSVAVYAFDVDGNMVWHGTDRGERLAADGYALDLPLPAGDYRIVAWCGLDDGESFTVGVRSRSDLADMVCTLNTEAGAGGTAYCDDDLHPLFYGSIDVTLPTMEDGGEYTCTVPLVKDTNVFRIVLQQMSGDGLDSNDFEFSIEGAGNARLDSENGLMEGGDVTYGAWSKYSGEAGVTDEDGTVVTGVSAVVAELTVGRLMMLDWKGDRNRPVLTVRKKDGSKVLSIPVIDYALLVKGKYNREMSNQEYLDRQDEYNMTFFLDADHKWLSASVIINSWRVVLDNVDL